MIAMSDHYDRLENRTSAARESALFRDLRHVLAVAKPRVPALRAQLKGIDITKLLSRADLARIPLRRRADVLALQAEAPPFGGLGATRLSALNHTFIGPGALVSLEGQAKDWWGMARALFAAGLRKGSLVLNCFSYDFVPQGHMIESGARALGCPVIPAGNASLAQKVDAISRLRPRFFCGEPEHLKALLDHGHGRGADMSCITDAIVMGSLKRGLRNELGLRGVTTRLVFTMPELGLIAFESETTDGLTVNEGLIVEIVEPGTGTPVARGAPGEIVVTRINVDYPLVRYATGFLSAPLPPPSASGRTNMRIRAPRDMTPESADVCGTRIDVTHILEIAKRHPDAGRMRLCMRRRRDRDELHLKVEHGGNAPTLTESLGETLHAVTRVRGTVELLQPGTLSDDDAVIVDERPLN